MSAPRKAKLTDRQRRLVERARELAAADAEDIAIADADPGNLAMLYAVAFGSAQATVEVLLEVIDEISGGAR